MNKQKMQVVNDRYTRKVTASWLKDSDKPSGRQKFYHADCEIWLVGRDSDIVGNVIMNALQDKNMSCYGLRRMKRGAK